MAEKLYIVATMKAKHGQQAKLRELLLAAVPKFRDEPGCISYALHEDLMKPELFVTYECWDDEAALQGHMKAPTLTQLTPLLKDILEAPLDQIRLRLI